MILWMLVVVLIGLLNMDDLISINTEINPYRVVFRMPTMSQETESKLNTKIQMIKERQELLDQNKKPVMDIREIYQRLLRASKEGDWILRNDLSTDITLITKLRGYIDKEDKPWEIQRKRIRKQVYYKLVLRGK